MRLAERGKGLGGQEGRLMPLSARLISGSCRAGRRGSPFKAEGLFKRANFSET